MWQCSCNGQIFGFRYPSVDCVSVFSVSQCALPLWCSSGRLLCILLWFGLTVRGSQNYKRLYLCICLALLPYCCFVSPNVLELIEQDPLTAVWNNETSFPPKFSPPGWPLAPALRSTSKCLISVESGAEGIIDHTESLHIYCFCTEGAMVLWSQKPCFQNQKTMFGHYVFFLVCFSSL